MATLDQPRWAPTDRPPMVTEMKRGGVSQPEDRHITKPPRDLPFLMDGDFLQVTNDDTKTWDFRWGRKHFTVSPNNTAFVAFEALVNALGDPRSMDNQLVRYSDGDGNKGIVMDRHAEITRLFAIYAIENENVDDLVDAAPKLTVRTLSGQMVRFPTQLPDMLPFPVMMVDEHAVNSDTMQITDRLAAENTDLRDRIADLEEKMERAIQSREGVEQPEA